MELVFVIPPTFTLSSLVYSHCHCKQRQKICCLRISTYVSSIPMSMSTITKFWDLKLWHSWSEDTAILNLQLEWLSLQPQSHFIVPIALSELNWAVVLTHWLALQCRWIRQNLIDQLLFWRTVALNPFLVLTFEGWFYLVAMCNWHCKCIIIVVYYVISAS